MLSKYKGNARRACRIVVAFIPWLASMYLFYWLDSSGTWTSETPHRGKISVAMLSAGMGLSFLIYSVLQRRNSA
jgi:hypothetical protein